MCGRSRGERGRLAWKRFVRLQSRRQPINPSGPSPLGDTHHQHRDHDDEHRSVVVAGVGQEMVTTRRVIERVPGDKAACSN